MYIAYFFCGEMFLDQVDERRQCGSVTGSTCNLEDALEKALVLFVQVLVLLAHHTASLLYTTHLELDEHVILSRRLKATVLTPRIHCTIFVYCGLRERNLYNND